MSLRTYLPPPSLYVIHLVWGNEYFIEAFLPRVMAPCNKRKHPEGSSWRIKRSQRSLLLPYIWIIIISPTCIKSLIISQIKLH